MRPASPSADGEIPLRWSRSRRYASLPSPKPNGLNFRRARHPLSTNLVTPVCRNMLSRWPVPSPSLHPEHVPIGASLRAASTYLAFCAMAVYCVPSFLRTATWHQLSPAVCATTCHAVSSQCACCFSRTLLLYTLVIYCSIQHRRVVCSARFLHITHCRPEPSAENMCARQPIDCGGG